MIVFRIELSEPQLQLLADISAGVKVTGRGAAPYSSRFVTHNRVLMKHGLVEDNPERLRLEEENRQRGQAALSGKAMEVSAFSATPHGEAILEFCCERFSSLLIYLTEARKREEAA